MTMTLRNIAMTSVIALGLAAVASAPAIAQDVGGWDMDGDTMLSESEFATGFAERGIFDRWDADGDGLLSEVEFGGGVFGTYDRDVSGGLDETEYGLYDDRRSATGYWGDEEAGYTYQAWDIDGDGVILSNEFADGLVEMGMLGEWDMDSDGYVSEDEFIAGVFNKYDEDGTGFIEEPELTDIGDDMGDEGFWDV